VGVGLFQESTQHLVEPLQHLRQDSGLWPGFGPATLRLGSGVRTTRQCDTCQPTQPHISRCMRSPSRSTSEDTTDSAKSMYQRSLEKMTLTKLVKEFPAFYETRRFITVLSQHPTIGLCSEPTESCLFTHTLTLQDKV
jgi:hypothetical protein